MRRGSGASTARRHAAARTTRGRRRPTRLLGALLVVATVGVSCTGGGAAVPTSTQGPDAINGSATSPTPTALRAIIDWVDFVQVEGVVYGSVHGMNLTDADLGPALAVVQHQVSTDVEDPSYRLQDGDAAFLTVGTQLYPVAGFAPTFRLAAHRDGQLVLYEADTNPAAREGRDLLDIEGRVSSIRVLSATDGSTELATVDDPVDVNALVSLVLAAPVDQAGHGRQEPRYFISFDLDDGTHVSRVFWLGSVELHRGIMLPDEFGAAIERALTDG